MSYLPIIHNKRGEQVVQLVETPTAALKSTLLTLVFVKHSYPTVVEKWAWLNAYIIAVIIKTSWNLRLIENSSASAYKLMDEFATKNGGASCFCCRKPSVSVKRIFGRGYGFSCKTKNCVLHKLIIPGELVQRADEMPDYSSEPEYPMLEEFIRLMSINEGKMRNESALHGKPDAGN